MAKLKNDMAWDTNSINEFIELSSAMLDKANRISADMESIISTVSATYNSIPADLKDSSLGQALGSASAGINGNRFVQTKTILYPHSTLLRLIQQDMTMQSKNSQMN